MKNKRFLKIISFITLTLAGITIAVIVYFGSSGKELVFAGFTVISLFISAYIFYKISKNIPVEN